LVNKPTKCCDKTENAACCPQSKQDTVPAKCCDTSETKPCCSQSKTE
jgi:hypothetical protein